MKKFLVVTIAMLTLSVVPVVLMASSPTAGTSGGVDLEAAKTVFESTCSKCHSTSRALGKKKDQAGWENTVDRMAAYHQRRFDQPISGEDQKLIVQYLMSAAGK